MSDVVDLSFEPISGKRLLEPSVPIGKRTEHGPR